MARTAASRTNARGFDFTDKMRAVCEDIVTRLPQMRHIDLSRVAISFAQTRKGVQHGLWASLTPLRFEHGELTGLRRGRRYSVQRLFWPDGREVLYILTFYLPRFMQLDLRDKLVTIVHELWHISPEFNGDLRRHSGRCYAHTHSEKQYDAAMEKLVRQWLAHGPPPALFEFLLHSFDDLQRQFGSVRGVKVRQPKLVPVAD